MSIPTGYQGLRVDRGEMIVNKTPINFSQSGDDNANQLSLTSDQKGRGLIEDLETRPSLIPPLVSQSGSSSDNLMIWGTEPELREYETLECQNVDAFLGGCEQERENEEEDDDGTSFRDGKDEGPMSISSSSTASSVSVGVRRNDNDSNKVEGRKGKEVKARIVSQSAEELDTCVTASEVKKDTRLGRAGDRERRKGGLKESKSETNVYVPSLSAVSFSGSLSSALDSGRQMPSFITLSSSSKSSHYSTTSAECRQRGGSVDASHTSPPSNPQEKYTQKSCEDLRQEGSRHRNGLSSDSGLGQRRKAGFEERVMPPRRQQLVRPLCQTEMVRARSLAETGVQQADTRQTDPNSNGSSRKLIKSSLREPSDFSSLYSTPGITQPRQPNQATQKETPPSEKQSAAATWRSSSTTNPSALEKRSQPQLTYRRNCSSPNRTGIDSRSSTPPHSPLRTPQGSPHRQPSMYLVSRTVSGVTRQIPQGCNPTVTGLAQGNGSSCIRAPVKTNISTSGIPKAPLSNQQISNPNSGSKDSSTSPKLKPKGVRPKIITYVRKNPQFKPQVSDGPYQVSSLPSRLSSYAHGQTASSSKEGNKEQSKAIADAKGAPVLSASNLLYDKYRQGLKSNIFPPGLLNRGIRPPSGHTHTVPPSHSHSHTAPPKLTSKADNFYGGRAEVNRSDEALQPQTAAQAGGSGSLLRTGRGMRLGLGAVTRNASGLAKGKVLGQGQKPVVFSQPIQPVSPEANQKSQDDADEVFISAPLATAAAQPQSATSRSLLPKSSQSGLRPPGYSSGRGSTASRLAAFGFVRSSSVSSVTSAHSNDSTQSDPCRTAHRLSVSEEPPLHRVATGTLPVDHHQRGYSLQPPSTPALPRRFLPAQPRNSPGAGRKEFQRSSEVARSLPSSPKRLAVVPPKPQSPVQCVQRPAAAVRGSAPPGSPRRVAPLRLQQESLQKEKEEAQQKERERQAEEREKEEQRQEVQRLQGRCELQERQLSALREELRRTTLGLEAFIVTTQHYCLKNAAAEESQEKLSTEMRNLKEEMASNAARWERLHQEKAALEMAFERELQELQLQQEAELAAVEESIRKCHLAEAEHLKAEHRAEMEELRVQQQEQVEELTVNHQAATQELRDMHNITMATLHEEHARTMRDLRKAHEQQKALLEEDFEKLRLSLQDQVDTLTFQNQSLKDKARRFEEALRRSTDEQIVEALAPYQHIEQDLKSLKEVVEMKNQQIHQQEKKITDLEKVQAQKNVFLEERVQVLQQQNEDLLAQIQMNLAISRQLSEENANLHESVEKESTEKKRLSMNNEELLWRLQTSPLMSPASSPLHRSFSTSPVPSSPLFLLSSSPSNTPAARCDSPTHCQGCSQTPLYGSPSHRAGANHNLSSSPATPTHRAASNLNYSPGPATPTHRASANRCNPAACLSSLQR